MSSEQKSRMGWVGWVGLGWGGVGWDGMVRNGVGIRRVEMGLGMGRYG